MYLLSESQFKKMVYICEQCLNDLSPDGRPFVDLAVPGNIHIDNCRRCFTSTTNILKHALFPLKSVYFLSAAL